MKRLLPFVVLILLLLAGIISVPFLLRPESHRQEITDTLSKLLKRPVVIGQISMGYLPPTLRLGPVAVMNDAGNPILQVETASAPLDWTALFHLRLIPQEVELHRWSLSILRKPGGTWDLEDWLPGASELSGAKAWPLRQVRWKEGEIHWVDRYASVPQELVLSTVEGQWDPRPETIETQAAFTGIGAGVRLTFNAKGHFFSSPEWSGDLELKDQDNSAAFHLVKNADVLDAKGQSSKWRLATAISFLKFYGRGSAASVDSASPLVLENWQMHAKMGKTHLSFEHDDRISGGLSEIKGTIDAQAAGPLLHAEIAMRDVPAEAVLNLAGEKILLDGKMTVVLKNFEVVLSSATASTFKGDGYGELKDGHYRLPEFSVQKLAKAKTMAYVKKKFPDLSNKGMPITKMSAHWKAKGGAISVDDGFLASTDIKASWVGKLDAVRQGLDGYLRLQIREKDPKLSRLIPSKYQSQPAFGRLQGTWQEWFLRAIPSSKIPSAVQTKLRKAIR